METTISKNCCIAGWSSSSSMSGSSASTSMASNASRPRIIVSSRSAQSSESRRLFDADDDDAEAAEDDKITVDGLQLSPPRVMQRPRVLLEELDHGGLTAPTPFSTCRKRPASDAPFEPTVRSVETGSQGMHLSPHISPNSFLTMDGRFVQSKNPFSSPMMTDDDSQYVGSLASHQQVACGVLAPTMPVMFQSDNYGAGDRLCALPPRHHHQKPNQLSRQNFPGLSSYGAHEGFPTKYFFTGSPIQEDEVMEDSLSTSMASASTSGGSLTKVRRFNMSDDIVAASGQEISSYKQNLTVETNATDVDLTMIGLDPSPTDILSFPTPPTPIKVKAHPKYHDNYYNMIRRQDPTTPSQERRGIGMAETKTPHPGGGGRMQLRIASHTIPSSSYPTSSMALSRFTNDFDVISELGRGSFGCVYKVLSRLDGCMYAIKAAQRQAKGPADRDRMLKEVYALAALSDQADTATFHIVRYHQAWMEDDRLYIQTELCSGTLAGEMALGPLTEPRRIKVLREMLLALDIIHRMNMIHLDIKPANIFVKNDQYKLGDFGLVTRASADQEVEEGDSRYMSMELLSGDRSDLTKSDIFSLGATLYELCLHRPLPMNGPEWQSIRAGNLIHPVPNTSNDLVAIVSQMMNPIAAMRPTAGQLLQHPRLLSDEQKALNAEKSRVMALQLAQVHHRFPPVTMPPRRGLMRSNTWNGSSINSYL